MILNLYNADVNETNIYAKIFIQLQNYMFINFKNSYKTKRRSKYCAYLLHFSRGSEYLHNYFKEITL